MKRTTCALVVALCASAGAHADCTAPEAPALPDGANASMEEMLAGQKAVKSFQEANMDYMKCVEARIEAARKAGKDAETEDARDAAAETYTAAVEAYNKAVSAEETVAGDFNTQVREYKAANQ
ncbi:MAG: hypothetical protein ACX93N_12440 [Pseudohaliea sp.]